MPISLYTNMQTFNHSDAERNVSTGNTNWGHLANETKTTKAVKTLALSTLIAAAIFGNSLVIASVYKNINKRMRVASNYLVVNLSITDMLLAIFSLSRLIILSYIGFEWPFDGVFGVFSCKAHNFFIVHLLFVSTRNFMAIAVDRFVAVFFPLSAIMKGKLLYLIIAATWLIPFCFFAFYWKMMDVEVRLAITVCYANVLEVFPTVKDSVNFQTAQNIVLTGVTLAITAAPGTSTWKLPRSKWSSCSSSCSHDGYSSYSALYLLVSSLDNFLHLRYKPAAQGLQKPWCEVREIRLGIFEECDYAFYLPVFLGELSHEF